VIGHEQHGLVANALSEALAAAGKMLPDRGGFSDPGDAGLQHAVRSILPRHHGEPAAPSRFDNVTGNLRYVLFTSCHYVFISKNIGNTPPDIIGNFNNSELRIIIGSAHAEFFNNLNKIFIVSR
jgi:hypothetical protein